MAAPLIAKGARVITKPKTRSARGTQRSMGDPLPRTVEHAPSASEKSAPPPAHSRMRPTSRKQMLRRAVLPQVAGIEQKVWAFSAAYFILACTLPFYAPQLFFFMFGIAGLGLEAIPILDWIVPGTEVFLLAWAFTLLIGVGSMLFAAVIFSLRGIDAFGGSRSFVFICCLIGYLTLFLSIIPWVAVWALYVAYAYSTNESQ